MYEYLVLDVDFEALTEDSIEDKNFKIREITTQQVALDPEKS